MRQGQELDLSWGQRDRLMRLGTEMIEPGGDLTGLTADNDDRRDRLRCDARDLHRVRRGKNYSAEEPGSCSACKDSAEESPADTRVTQDSASHSTDLLSPFLPAGAVVCLGNGPLYSLPADAADPGEQEDH